MNFDNGHRQRQGQHNKRGRGRSNRRSGGGGGGGQHGGANSINRVYESNGPDVKVRGTAQTIAEKYMQLGRDAHSAGDNVMAESYYQFAEHYFRVLQSAQPPGQFAPQILRRPGEEPEEEVEVSAEQDEAAQAGDSEGGEGLSGADEGGSQPMAEAGQPGERQEQRPREQEGREGNRERFRPRWQQRRDSRDRGQDGPRDGQQSLERGAAEAGDAPAASRREEEPAEQDGNWEAPSFLKRPLPVVAAETVSDAAEEPRAPRPRRGRPAAAAEEAAPTPAVEE